VGGHLELGDGVHQVAAAPTSVGISAEMRANPPRNHPVHLPTRLRTVRKSGAFMSSTSTDTDRAEPFTKRQKRRVIAKLFFLVAGTLSFLLSVGLWFVTGDIDTAIYVGLWVPSLFSLGSLVLAHEGDR
jgi:hypothetical protein